MHYTILSSWFHLSSIFLVHHSLLIYHSTFPASAFQAVRSIYTIAHAGHNADF